MFSAQLSSELTPSEQIALWNFLEENYAKKIFNFILESEETDTLLLLDKLFPSVDSNLDEKVVKNKELKSSSIYKFAGDFFALFLEAFNSNLKCEEIIQLMRKKAPEAVRDKFQEPLFISNSASDQEKINQDYKQTISIKVNSRQSVWPAMQENYLRILLETARVIRNRAEIVTTTNLFKNSDVLKNCYEQLNIAGKLNEDDQAILMMLVERYINAFIIMSDLDLTSWKSFIDKSYNLLKKETFTIYNQIKNNPNFPTVINAEMDPTLREKWDAFDLLLHIPEKLLIDYPLLAQKEASVCSLFESKKATCDAGPSTSQPKSKMTNTYFSKPKPAPKFTVKPKPAQFDFSQRREGVFSDINRKGIEIDRMKKECDEKVEKLMAQIKKMKNFYSENNSSIDPFENSILHIAVLKGDINTLQNLIENYSDVNVPNKDKNTPLHLAVATKNKDCIRILIDAGASNDAENKDGMSVWLLAMNISEDIACQVFQRRSYGRSYGIRS